MRDEAGLRTAAGTFERLDVVVAAAAVIAGGKPLWETPSEDVQQLWQVDAMGMWLTAAVSVPLMLAGPDPSGCRFVGVASVAGSRGLFHLGAYTMVKHAVVGLVRGLAADLTGTGVVAVAVAPGATRTAMLDATAALYGLDDTVAARGQRSRPRARAGRGRGHHRPRLLAGRRRPARLGGRGRRRLRRLKPGRVPETAPGRCLGHTTRPRGNLFALPWPHQP